VDVNKDINFFAKLDRDAPFNLTDDGGNYDCQSLVINKSVDDLRNSVYVRGGEFLSDDTFTENLDTQADGSNDKFQLSYRYKNYSLTVNGTTLDVGVENIDEETDYDAMYNFSEKTVRFVDETKIPEAEDEVRFTGNIYIPVQIRRRDTDNIDDVGQEFEHVIIDKQIRDTQTAIDRANAELENFARVAKSGGFNTQTDGLVPGQKINIQSTIRGLDDDYIISTVRAKPVSYKDFGYSVEFITRKTNNFIDLMQKLLLQENKNIDVSDEESQQIDYFEDFTDQIVLWSLTNSINPWGDDEDPIWVTGEYHPLGHTDQRRVPRTDAGVKLRI